MKQGQLRMRLLRQLKRITDSSLRSMRKIGWNEDVAEDRLSNFWHCCGCHSGFFHLVSFFLCNYRKAENFAAPGLSYLPPALAYSVDLSRPKENCTSRAREAKSQSVGVESRS